MGISALVIFSMMSVTFVDVVGRYIFNHPIPGGYELVEFMMPLAMFVALPVVTRESGHISISVLENALGPTGAWIQQLVILIGTAGSVAFIGWVLWLQGQELRIGQNISGDLEWPLAPPAYAVSGLCALTVVVVIAAIVHHLRTPAREFARGRSDSEQHGSLD